MTPEALVWIEEQKSDLVVEATKFVDQNKTFRPAPPRKNRKPKNEPRVSPSQLRNLLSTARDEPFEVLCSYLRYQIGRGDRGWGDEASGTALLRLLETAVRARIEGAESLGEPDALQSSAISRRLASLLIGFIIREHTYRAAIEKSTQPQHQSGSKRAYSQGARS